MFSTLPASSFASPTSSFLDRSAASSSPESSHCIPQDALLYNFGYSPSASPFSYHHQGHHQHHHGRELYHVVSPSHAPYLHGMAPAMYATQPTIGPPHHKRLRAERDLTLDDDGDDDDGRGCESSASDDVVAARRHRRKRHHAASGASASETVPVYISKEEYRKMKNRQSAARSREKSLAKVRVLERRVAELEQENDYLLELLASVSSVKPVQPARPAPPVAAQGVDDNDGQNGENDAETATDELMDRVASHCAEGLYDGVEWCL